ncbi:hypothetical protein B296_00013843 [Ensete ventricosum]|uniref:Uncharacterized protein n=1 Tax=Ensete ventricosum TaxID=4639 RepID=A0A426YWW3_ENSVE|nr:hypothetical protein B296_00013843 [Ensete ventricosum]
MQRGDWLRSRPPTQGAAGCGQPTGAVGAYGGQPARDDRQRPAHKGLLAHGEVVGAMPARCQAAMVGCPWRGHRGSTRRLNRGSNGGAEREEEDLGHSF